MIDLNPTFDMGAETFEEAIDSTEALEARLAATRSQIDAAVSSGGTALDIAKLQLDEAELLNELERGNEAWALARPVFDVFAEAKEWALAAETCDVLSQTETEGVLPALANGIWIAVTFPIDPQISLSLLQYVIDETPDNSDGAAVAAAVAKYIVDLRADEDVHNDLSFFAMQMMGAVARRHSDIKEQDEFDAWVKKLELDEPEKFLVRLRNVIDVMAQEDWWMDRDALRDELPG